VQRDEIAVSPQAADHAGRRPRDQSNSPNAGFRPIGSAGLTEPFTAATDVNGKTIVARSRSTCRVRVGLATTLIP